MFEVIVIGGGPAGMMAAGRAAECGARVLLVEKNDSVGKKLRITGGGRCNLTNALPDRILFAEKFGKKGKLLLPALARFDTNATREFFHQRGLPTKIEAENRVFPLSDRADDVADVMKQYISHNDVAIQYHAVVEGFEMKNDTIVGVRVNGSVMRAKTYILATGGTSRPETGSSGDGFEWLRRIGHAIVDPNAALVPVTIQDEWVREAQGVSLPVVKLSLVHRGKKQRGQVGKILLTHFGVSGPLVLNMSRSIKKVFGTGKTQLSLDLFPGTDGATLDTRLRNIFASYPNKKIKNSLGDFVPSALTMALLALSHINPDTAVREVTRQERLALCETAKDMRMTVSGFLGLDKAVVSSGGVDVNEVDLRTMQSRLFPSLYIIGDMLDFNRPSGGFSLQICWTTGFIAGENAANKSLGVPSFVNST